MADLITAARAKYNIAQASFTSAENDAIDALVTACSRTIRKYCRREFDSQSFDELHHGIGQAFLVLRQAPVISVERVARCPTPVLHVTNASAANQRANVRVTTSGLSLTRVASGVATTDSLAFADNVTLNAMKTAIDALGNGWSATVIDSAYNDRAAADLRAMQGAYNAKDVVAELRLHLYELSDFEVDAERAFLFRSRYGSPDLFDDVAVFLGGYHYWRVVYTAGFATVPEDVQEACAQWVAALFWQTKRDPGLAQESIVGATSRSPYVGMPPSVAVLLYPYRQHALTNVG